MIRLQFVHLFLVAPQMWARKCEHVTSADSWPRHFYALWDTGIAQTDRVSKISNFCFIKRLSAY